MSVLRSRTERCAPRRSFLVVSSANQRSTRFSHELDVGVKCRTKRGCASSHLWIAGVLCVLLLSSTTWTSSSAGTSRSSVCRNCLNSIARWRLCKRPITLPVPISSAALQAGGAVTLVVMGGALGQPWLHRQDRSRAVERLDLAFLV